jgi:phospholipid N-methyltransferase
MLLKYKKENIMENSVRQLHTEQTKSFDTEYIDSQMFERLTEKLDLMYPTNQSFNLLDVGGGNGLYADKILSQYPDSRVTLIEPEQSLIEKNRPHYNKTLHCTLFQNQNLDTTFDIVQFNWVLHHFIGDTYSSSIALQKSALQTAYDNLSQHGIVVIFENFYEGSLVSNLPGALIYQLTSSKLLAPVTKKLGANTSGVGVCFNSRTKWHDMLLETGFKEIFHVPFYEFGNLGLLKTKLLHLKSQQVGLIIARK